MQRQVLLIDSPKTKVRAATSQRLEKEKGIFR
jgi:hypothetical protein